jgi:hypothetical protein
MNNGILQLKVKQRLNKLASNDYDNIECWQIVEAFNKGQVDWCRRNLHGLNIKQEGDEQSKRRIDDLNVLLNDSPPIVMVNRQTYYESPPFPANYLEWKRVSIKATSECCPKPRLMVVYEVEDGNIPIILRDTNKKPSFEWGETVVTLKDNKFQVYTNGEFAVAETVLTYYRQPQKIQILNCVDPYTQQISTVDVECEFKDDLTELLIDEAAKILAGDIESMNQVQRLTTSVEGNN